MAKRNIAIRAVLRRRSFLIQPILPFRFPDLITANVDAGEIDRGDFKPAERKRPTSWRDHGPRLRRLAGHAVERAGITIRPRRPVRV